MKYIFLIIILLLSTTLSYANHHGIGCLYDYDQHKKELYKIIGKKTGMNPKQIDAAVQKTILQAARNECRTAGTKFQKGCLSYPVSTFATCKINIANHRTIQWCNPLDLVDNIKTVSVQPAGIKIQCKAIKKYCYPKGEFKSDGTKNKPTHSFCTNPLPKALLNKYMNAPIPTN